jgi:hypothetical protein
MSRSSFTLEQIVERERSVLRHDDLAIEDEVISLQAERRLDQIGKIARQWAAGLGLKNDLASIAKDEAAKAVPFGLVQPAVSGRDRVDRERLHWREGRTPCASALPAPFPTGRTFSGVRQRPRSESESGWECQVATREGNGPLLNLRLDNYLINAGSAKEFSPTPLFPKPLVGNNRAAPGSTAAPRARDVGLERDDFWLDRWPLVVIAREGGRSSNRKTLRLLDAPLSRGMTGEERSLHSPGTRGSGTRGYGMGQRLYSAGTPAIFFAAPRGTMGRSCALAKVRTTSRSTRPRISISWRGAAPRSMPARNATASEITSSQA